MTAGTHDVITIVFTSIDSATADMPSGKAFSVFHLMNFQHTIIDSVVCPCKHVVAVSSCYVYRGLHAYSDCAAARVHIVTSADASFT